MMLLSGIENTVILFLFLRGIYKFSTQSSSFKNKSNVLVFCIIFSITFGVAIGIATRNFGALARYKVPFLPFFVSALMVWNYKKEKVQKIHREYLKKRYLAWKASM
jgi:hypothetical protein